MLGVGCVICPTWGWLPWWPADRWPCIALPGFLANIALLSFENSLTFSASATAYSEWFLESPAFVLRPLPC